MKLTNLKPRSKLVCRMTETEGHEFVVRLEEVLDDELFCIDLPVVTGGPVRFKAETKLDFIHIADDGILYFRGTVRENNERFADYMIVAMTSSMIKRVQRRNFFRLEVSGCCIVKKFGDFFSFQEKSDRSLVENISAGGVKFSSLLEHYRVGELIHIGVEFFPGIEGLWAEIVYIKKLDISKDKYAVSVSAKFVNMDDKEVNYMVRCMYDKQREISKVSTD